jgi:tripartite-type tricarboxylate transporter receptor subunit TctC
MATCLALAPSMEMIVSFTLRAYACATAISMLTICPSVVRAQDVFKGKTINIVVGYSVGGGYDQYARTLARYLGNHIPGQPTIIVQNMPGAASLLAVRHLDANPAKDGTVITAFDPGLITAHISPEGVPKVDFRDYKWIGAMLRDVRICYAWHATGVKTWDDLMARKEFIIGATARGSNAFVNGAIVRLVMNAPVRQISGYPGSNEQRLALERGELEGTCASWSAMPPEWLSEKKAFPLVRFSRTRPIDMPESIPYVGDLTNDPEKKQLLDLLNAPTDLGRPFIVAKQVPDVSVNVLRAGYEGTLKDQGFLADMAKQTLPIDSVPGQDAEKIVQQIYSANQTLMRKMVEVLQ